MTDSSGGDGPRVVGVLLAAGRSTRFGESNKLLADVDGEPVVRHSARTLLAAVAGGDDADANPVTVVVLGHEADAVRESLSDLPVETVENNDYAAGQATSVARGVAWARERDADAVLVALGDMPWVDSDTCDRLLAAFADSDRDIAVPTYEGRRGNPVVFGARHFDALADVEGDVGGRALFDAEPVAFVAVDDPGIHRDVDTVDDLVDGGEDAAGRN